MTDQYINLQQSLAHKNLELNKLEQRINKLDQLLTPLEDKLTRIAWLVGFIGVVQFVDTQSETIGQLEDLVIKNLLHPNVRILATKIYPSVWKVTDDLKVKADDAGLFQIESGNVVFEQSIESSNYGELNVWQASRQQNGRITWTKQDISANHVIQDS